MAYSSSSTFSYVVVQTFSMASSWFCYKMQWSMAASVPWLPTRYSAFTRRLAHVCRFLPEYGIQEWFVTIVIFLLPLSLANIFFSSRGFCFSCAFMPAPASCSHRPPHCIYQKQSKRQGGNRVTEPNYPFHQALQTLYREIIVLIFWVLWNKNYTYWNHELLIWGL